MEIKRHANIKWTGGLRDGKGLISTQSGALQEYPYGFASRFEGVAGSNPEELIAAAHAACFTMSLTLGLEKAGLVAERLETEAIVTLAGDASGYSIPHIRLRLRAAVPGASSSQVAEIAREAERNCPVSKLFKATIDLEIDDAATA